MRRMIYVVDADSPSVRLLRETLEPEGFSLCAFPNAAAVLQPGARPHLFLLERSLPDMDGLQLCSEIRRFRPWSEVPVIFVTGSCSEDARIEGLRLADDFITKPYSPLELLARIHAVLRRSRQQHPPARMTVGELELDSESLRVQVQGREVNMTAMEFRLLAYLASNPGKTFNRDQLLDAVWDARFVTPRTVDVHIRRLREKIEEQPESPRYVQTIRGRGYRLVSPQSTPHPMPDIKSDRLIYSVGLAV